MTSSPSPRGSLGSTIDRRSILRLRDASSRLARRAFRGFCGLAVSLVAFPRLFAVVGGGKVGGEVYTCEKAECVG